MVDAYPYPQVSKVTHAAGARLPIAEWRLLLAGGDLIAVICAALIALRLWAWVGDQAFTLGFVVSQTHWFIILTLLWLMLASANDYYDLALTARWLRSQARLIQITLQQITVYLLMFLLSPRDELPRLFILYYAVASYLLIAARRLSRPFLISWVPLRRRALIVGAGWEAQTIVDAIQSAAPDDYEIVGIVREVGAEPDSRLISHTPVVQEGRDLVRIAQRLDANEVILAAGERIHGELFQGVMDCYEAGIPLTPKPLLYERLTGMVPVEQVGGDWNIVLPLEGLSPFDLYPLLKRLMDIALSLIGLVILGLMLPFIALLIKLDSPGPIFFWQERTGKAGRPYRLIKLRSMLMDAEVKGSPLWAVAGDPRITRVGSFLRKSRLDETPQLLNVLKGEMSMIGPRPERPFFVEKLQQTVPFYRARLVVRPGVTGWAQVNYRYGNNEHDALIKLKYDLYYIRHRSIALDVLILLRTVARVLRLEGM
jgi:exopolysaccharide biosynthesis polyprenyl glycosylphosphotransferase